MAAQNRNEGVALVPDDFDVISFFDSDDIMHPRRMELIERCYKEHPTVDVVLHSAQSGPLVVTEDIVWDPIEEPLRVNLNQPTLKDEIASWFAFWPHYLKPILGETL
jgi:hypothetical protein